MRKFIYILSFFLVTIFYYNCGKDLPQLPTLDLEITRVENLDSLYLQAQIIHPNKERKVKTRNFGFLLSNGEYLEGVKDKKEVEKFTSTTKNLGLNKFLSVQAGIEALDPITNNYKWIYSDSFPIRTNTIQLFTNSGQITDDKITLISTVSGPIEEGNFKHGHIWKVTNLDDKMPPDLSLVDDVLFSKTEQYDGTQSFSTKIDVELGPKLVYAKAYFCLLYTSPSPRDATLSRMPSSA